PRRAGPRPLRAVELRGHELHEARHPEVRLPRPHRQAETRGLAEGIAQARRGARGDGGQGRRRLPPGRQGAAPGGSPGLPATVHLRHQGRQASPPRRRAPRKDGRPARLLVPRGVTAASPPSTAPAGNGRGASAGTAAILRTEGLSMRFGGLAALNNVSVTVPRGEIRAVIGPNGAGKSTFFNCLTGVLTPTSGRIVFDG